jgi:hypothetical protein
MAGLARTLVVGWFVQGDVQMLAVEVRFAKDGKFEAVGFDAGMALGDDRSGDADFTIADQLAAPLAGAEALRLQDAIQGVFAHVGRNRSGNRLFNVS